MAEEKKGRRAYSSHAECGHADTQAARKRCRHLREHADCDHGSSAPELRACTRQRNQIEKVSVDVLISALT